MTVVEHRMHSQRAEPATAPRTSPARVVRAVFPAEPASGTLARRFVSRECGEWVPPEVIVDAELVVTELVENAVRHGRSDCVVTVELSERGLRIAVRDRSRALPRRVSRPPTQPGGRGLLLVERLSQDWGVEPDDEGKTVWALLATPGACHGGEMPVVL